MTPLPAAGVPRTGTWLLILSPLSYALVIALTFPLSVTLLPPGVSLFADLPRAALEAHGWAWIVVNAVILLPASGSIGILLIARRLRKGSPQWGSASGVFALLAIATTVIGALLRIAALGTDSPMLGSDVFYVAGTFLIGDLILALLATIFLCAALRQVAVLGAGAWVFAGLSASFVLWDILSYPLNLVFPPIAMTTVVWMPLGLTLFARGRRGSGFTDA